MYPLYMCEYCSQEAHTCPDLACKISIQQLAPLCGCVCIYTCETRIMSTHNLHIRIHTPLPKILGMRDVLVCANSNLVELVQLTPVLCGCKDKSCVCQMSAYTSYMTHSVFWHSNTHAHAYMCVFLYPQTHTYSYMHANAWKYAIDKKACTCSFFLWSTHMI
jgi:hypothetical protein